MVIKGPIPSVVLLDDNFTSLY